MTTSRSVRSIFLVLAAASATLAEPAAPSDRSPERLQALLQQLDALPADSPHLTALREQVDTEAGQRYAWASRLFWHTDLEQAKAEATKSQKPILSLRLLGRLTDELSCANSRFFRTVLYANEKISRQLRDDFVLHWSSERPVPVLTVDFGDGRVMKRTVTGNSIHYLLDNHGAPLDAMPGLVSPQAFSQWLSTSKEAGLLARQTLSRSRRNLMIQQIQMGLLMAQSTQWQQDVNKLRQLHPNIDEWMIADNPNRYKTQDDNLQVNRSRNAPPAELAVAAATPKRASEAVFIPLLTMSNTPIPDGIESNPDFWKALAELHLSNVTLDKASLALIAHQRPHAYKQGEPAVEAMLVEFKKNLALDTVRNQYLLQRKLRTWLFEKPIELTTLNQRVYSELFLTPRQDPYLGLLPADAYSGLEHSGLKDSASEPVPSAKVSALKSSAGG